MARLYSLAGVSFEYCFPCTWITRDFLFTEKFNVEHGHRSVQSVDWGRMGWAFQSHLRIRLRFLENGDISFSRRRVSMKVIKWQFIEWIFTNTLSILRVATGNPVVFTLSPPECYMEIRYGYGTTGNRVGGPVRVGDPLTLIIYMRSKYGKSSYTS